MKVKLLKLIRKNYDYRIINHDAGIAKVNNGFYFMSKDGKQSYSILKFDLRSNVYYSDSWVLLLSNMSFYFPFTLRSSVLNKFEKTRRIRKNKKEFKSK